MDPKNYGRGKIGPHITWYGERLVAHGHGDAYDLGPGPVWGPADEAGDEGVPAGAGLDRWQR